MAKKNKNVKKVYEDKRALEDVIADEKDLRFTFLFLVISILLYFASTTFFGISFMEPDVAAYVLVMISLCIYMVRIQPRYAVNSDEKYAKKARKDTILVLILLVIMTAVTILPPNGETLIVDGKLTTNAIPLGFLPFMILFYIVEALTSRKGKRELLEDKKFDETAVRAEIERRDSQQQRGN